MKSTVSRRSFIRSSIAAATAAAVGIHIPGTDALADPGEGWSWDKGACRFCGVGCGIQIATKDDRVVAVNGDPDCEVNRGLLCVKGYANALIPYGEDRLTQPLLRMKDGKFDKQGEFKPVSWERASTRWRSSGARAHAKLGPTGVGHHGSGQYTIQEGYAAVKL